MRSRTSQPVTSTPIDRAVLAARLDLMFGGQPGTLAVSVVLATILTIILFDAVDKTVLLGWLAVLVALSIVRGLTYRQYIRTREKAVLDLELWDRRFLIATTLAGVVWGSSALLFFPADATLQVFLAFVIAGVSSGAAAGLSMAPNVAQAFVVPCVLPLGVRLLAVGDYLHTAMGIMVLFYIALVVFTARRGRDQLTQTVTSQLEVTKSRRALADAENNWRISDEKLQALFEFSPLGIALLSERNELLDANIALLKIFQTSLDEVVPHWIPDDMEFPTHEIDDESSIDANLIGHREIDIVRSDGSKIAVSIYGMRILRPDGAAYRWAFVENIQDRKQAERIKGEFVSTVSHELRTPLTSIRGSLGLLTNDTAGVIPERAKALLKLAERNAERLSLLIDDLLDIEKIESGMLRLKLEIQALAPLVEQAIAANTPYASMHSVKLRLIVSSGDIKVVVDANRFMQVMANLLSNAAKFSPAESEVQVVVRLQDDLVRVEVTDFGPGIHPDFQSKIFSKFCQGDSSDSRQKGGTGLGLAISKAIVEKMSGRIGYETRFKTGLGDSAQGTGTTFYFDLPVVSSISSDVTPPSAAYAS